MAFQAEIVVALGEQSAIHRSMRLMADGAAFAQSFVFPDKRAGLFAVTIRAGFVLTGHRQVCAPRGLHDVHPVRIVAVHAIHAVFNDRMMLREIELGVLLQMAIKTGRCVFAGIDDELAAAPAGGDVFAAGAMAAFATCF